MAALSNAAIIALWIMEGGSISSAQMALARALSESTGNPDAQSPNPDGGTNVGLYQLDTPGGVGAGYTTAQLQNPVTNTRITVDATSNGSNWSDWQDNYQAFMGTAGSAVSAFKTAGGSDLESYAKTVANQVSTTVGSGVGGDTSGTGATPAPSDSSTLSSITSSISGIATDFDNMVKVFVWLSNPSHWVRIGAFFTGTVLLVIGVHIMAKK